MSLVPEYDSDDSSNSSDDESDEKIEEQKVNRFVLNSIPTHYLHYSLFHPLYLLRFRIELKSAKFLLSGETKTCEVFSNPFRAVEMAKLASLEKHVKMVNTDEQITVKNGKKICWNYRKGRCRFGSKCTFAHDSDVEQSTTIKQSVEMIPHDVTPPEKQITAPVPLMTTNRSEDHRKRKQTPFGQQHQQPKKQQPHQAQPQPPQSNNKKVKIY